MFNNSYTTRPSIHVDMNFLQISFVIGFLTFSISARKTDTFPPYEMLYKHFDIENTVKTCYERSGAKKEDLMEFEISEDLEHLPDNIEIRRYLRCTGELSEQLEVESNKVLLTKTIDFINQLPKEQQEIYLRMGRGCFKQVKHIKDLLEFAYKLAVCFKKNDNEHFYVFY